MHTPHNDSQPVSIPLHKSLGERSFLFQRAEKKMEEWWNVEQGSALDMKF